MSELKILGYINLPEKKIRPEEYRGFLEDKMSGVGKEVNEQFEHKLLDSSGSIIMSENSDLENDLKFVDDLENNWAREQHKTVAEWRESKKKNSSTITEMAVTLSLHRLLQERFIVARSSSYDDYKYGVDNVLIDKETGAVVCGFDEVLGHEGDDGGEKKKEKIEKILSRGGASLKYGATIEDGKIQRKELKNIPTFYLSLSKLELDNLLKDLKTNGRPTENERQIALKMIHSLEIQYAQAQENDYHPALKANLESFAKSLETIKEELNKN
jgi:hypothetical protein